MAKPKKGVIPPHLRKFLFKKGKAKRSSTRRRRKNPPTAFASRRRRHGKTLTRRVYAIITATRAGKRLHFDGQHFSAKHAARKFVTLELATAKAKQLLKTFPVLRGYQVHVRLSR